MIITSVKAEHDPLRDTDDQGYLSTNVRNTLEAITALPPEKYDEKFELVNNILSLGPRTLIRLYDDFDVKQEKPIRTYPVIDLLAYLARFDMKMRAGLKGADTVPPFPEIRTKMRGVLRRLNDEIDSPTREKVFTRAKRLAEEFGATTVRDLMERYIIEVINLAPYSPRQLRLLEIDDLEKQLISGKTA